MRVKRPFTVIRPRECGAWSSICERVGPSVVPAASVARCFVPVAQPPPAWNAALNGAFSHPATATDPT